MEKKRYQYLLMDFDNTLFDFDRAEETAFHAAFSAYGLVSDEKIYQIYHEINDGMWKKLERGEVEREHLKILRFEMLLEVLSVSDTDGLSRKLSDAYLFQLSEQNFLLPGAKEVCEALCRQYRLFIITNGSYSVQMKHYHNSGLESCFEDIFVSEKLGAAKPSAVYFSRVTERIGDPDVSRYLVIGDSLSSDIAGAAAAGMDAVWLNRNGKNNEQGLPVVHTVHDIRELPAYLGIQ